MSVVAFPKDGLSRLHDLAAEHDVETCAVGFVRPAGAGGHPGRFVVQALEPVPEAAYQVRTRTRASLAPEFMLDVVNRARMAGAGIALPCAVDPGSAPSLPGREGRYAGE